MATATIKIQVRRDTEINWLTANPILLEGEIGFITNTFSFVIGNGVDDFETLLLTSTAIFASQYYVNGQFDLVQSNLDTEVLDRQTADTTLQDNIDAEVLDRQNADNTLQDNIDAIQLYEVISFIDYQIANLNGTLAPARTYFVNDALISSFGFVYTVIFQSTTQYDVGYSNGLLEGKMIVEGNTGDSRYIFDVGFEPSAGNLIYWKNNAFNVEGTDFNLLDEILNVSNNFGWSAGNLKNCNLRNFVGGFVFPLSSGAFILHDVDLSNSNASLDFTYLVGTATLSGRILHDFVVPDQTLYPCDFTNTIHINADGTNNMVATITLGAAQSTLDYTGFESASTIVIIPDAGGHYIDTIINARNNREYIIVSNDSTGLLNISTGINILIADSINLFYMGLISWFSATSVLNKIYFTYNGTNALINNKTSTYA